MATAPLPRGRETNENVTRGHHDDWIELSSDCIDITSRLDWCTVPRCGAVVSFSGVVRDHAEGRAGVEALTYEAYEEPAIAAIREIVGAARQRWPDLLRVAVAHRLGRLELSDTAVVVVVSTPHRDDAFEAGRYVIDTLKEAVPIWKQEHWAEGSDWGLGAAPIRAVEPRADST